MDPKCDVTVDVKPDRPGRAGSSIKLQGENWELNIYLTSADLSRLPAVRQARWDDRKSLMLGKTASSQVYWAVDDDLLCVLVGQDDETWDFGVMLPLGILDKILEAVSRAAHHL
jgi:hypothetical protein